MKSRQKRTASVRLRIGVVFVLTAILLLPNVGHAEPIVIEHLLSVGSGEAIRQATEAAVELFHSVQDEIRVNTVYVGGNYIEHVVVRTAAGNPPDVMMSSLLGEIGGKGLTLPLDEFVDRDGLRDLYVPAALHLSTWDGELIQIPQWVQPAATFYNRFHFWNAGVEDPYELSRTGDWTWEAMAEAARSITRDTTGDGEVDLWGMSVRAHETHRVVFWLKQAGGYFFDKYTNPTKATVATEEVATALRFLYELVHERGAMPLEAAITTRGMPNFAQHNVGMIFEGPWAIGYMRTQGMPDDEWDIAPLPRGPVGDPAFIHIGGLQISRDSQHPEAAWEWVKFLTTDPRVLEIATHITGRPAAFIPALPNYTNDIVVDGRPQNADVLIEAMLNPDATPFFLTVDNVSAFNGIWTAEVRKYFNTVQDLRTTLENIEQGFNVELARIRE